jgi:hypothetical protein
MPHERFIRCIEACNECAVACDHCAASCLQMEDASAMARCIALDIDCAAICRLAAGFMARGSDLAPTICESCADVCEVCAEECGQHPDEHCQACAKACRRCAEECRKMAGAMPKGGETSAASEAHAH